MLRLKLRLANRKAVAGGSDNDRRSPLCHTSLAWLATATLQSRAFANERCSGVRPMARFCAASLELTTQRWCFRHHSLTELRPALELVLTRRPVASRWRVIDRPQANCELAQRPAEIEGELSLGRRGSAPAAVNPRFSGQNITIHKATKVTKVTPDRDTVMALIGPELKFNRHSLEGLCIHVITWNRA
jgi:hypothetical protein